MRRLFEEIMIYNNYERKLYFNFKPAMEIYCLLEEHFLVQSDCTFLLVLSSLFATRNSAVNAASIRVNTI